MKEMENGIILIRNNKRSLNKAIADWRNVKAELTNYYLTPDSVPRHTVQWNQFQYDMVGFGKTWVGCGAVAWGIVYAYWDSFKGKSNLFGSVKAYDYSTELNMLKSSVIKYVNMMKSGELP